MGAHKGPPEKTLRDSTNGTDPCLNYWQFIGGSKPFFFFFVFSGEVILQHCPADFQTDVEK